MANPIKIKLDTSQYKSPTQDDITSAKRFILQRNDYARLLESKIDDILEEAAVNIVTICYKYNVEPTDFTISSQYNEQMMDEISAVMDELEEECLELIYDYSSSMLDESKKDRKEALLLWLASLGRGNRNFQDTLDGYLYKTMKDWEAAIAALRYADVKLPDAITKIKTNLHTIYTMPEVTAAFRDAEDFNATYIRSRGVNAGAVGLSNNGSTNVTNMAKITLQMAWMRELGNDYKEDGAVGYCVFRGSSYPCDLCDDACGFHPLTDMSFFPPLHPHCCCGVIPIYRNEVLPVEENENEQDRNNAMSDDEDLYETVETDRGQVRIHQEHGKNERKENVEIATYLANKYGYSIDLLPIIDGKKSADSYNNTLDKKQEYKVNTAATKNSIDRLIRDARKQADSIIIRLDSEMSFMDLRDAITDRLRRAENITDITLIQSGKDVTYTRKQMLSDLFKIQPEDFK